MIHSENYSLFKIKNAIVLCARFTRWLPFSIFILNEYNVNLAKLNEIITCIHSQARCLFAPFGILAVLNFMLMPIGMLWA